jgi:SNF2 family DNA or RNA helicase
MPTKLIRPRKIHFHPHQKSAIRWMMERELEGATYARGGILADEMGLGKTWSTIGLLLNAPVADTLLLVPPVLQPQWCEALAKCGIAHTVLGSPRAKGTGGSWVSIPGRLAGIHVTVSTYDRASNNVDLVRKRVYDRILCDEGHIFRNGGKSRRFTRLLTIEAPRRWILTGTPIQNRKQDFRNLVTFLGMPLGERLKVPDATLAAELILRRTVGDVREAVPTMPAFKPTHTIHAVRMPSGSEEESVFSALIGRFEHAIEVSARSTVILELYLRIRQFLAHPAIYVDAMKRKYKTTYKRESWEGTASKTAAFERLLTDVAEPTIVFGTFRDELDYARLSLQRAGYKVWMIRGGMSDARRGAVTEESRAAVAAGDKVAIVVQIVAGGAGLNFQHCARVVFLSSHWNPAVVDQAIARAYRMGQAKPVTVHHLLLADEAEKNLDRYMAGMHGRKRGEALMVHAGLYCDTAVDAETLFTTLDDALDKSGAGVADDGLPHDPVDDLDN